VAATAAATTGGPAIETRQLTKRYGDVIAVDRLDLTVSAGEVFGLLGPNGAGKTTTILMLLGLSEPTAGTARVAGLDPARQPLEVKRRVGYLPDNVGFYGNLTGRQNLRYTARLNGVDPAATDRRLQDLLDQVGLADTADTRVDTYSRGMRQRLGIADALVKDPSVMILDEPTIAIDPEGVAEMLALIRFLARERGVALLLSSHLLQQVQSVCDRVGIFVKGRLVAQGRVQELAAQMSDAGVVIEVGAAGDPAEVERALLAVPGVQRVQRVARDERDPQRWRVTADDDATGALARSLVTAGLTVTSLRRHGDDLDELYRRYFENRQTATAAAGGGDGEHR